MTERPYPAFGHIVIIQKSEAGEVMHVNATALTRCTILYTKGEADVFNKDGDLQTTIYPGRFNQTDPHITGDVTVVSKTNRELLCFDPQINLAHPDPKLCAFSMRSGETRALKRGTKLFLATGSMMAGGKSIRSRRQLLVSSDYIEAQANEDCMGFIFE